MDVERKRKFENRGDEIVEELHEQFGRIKGEGARWACHVLSDQRPDG